MPCKKFGSVEFLPRKVLCYTSLFCTFCSHQSNAFEYKVKSIEYKVLIIVHSITYDVCRFCLKPRNLIIKGVNTSSVKTNDLFVFFKYMLK